ncbi:MAG: hypothetical protein ACYDCK_14910 [Thermoplasmatota archaeon]
MRLLVIAFVATLAVAPALAGCASTPPGPSGPPRTHLADHDWSYGPSDYPNIMPRVSERFRVPNGSNLTTFVVGVQYLPVDGKFAGFAWVNFTRPTPECAAVNPFNRSCSHLAVTSGPGGPAESRAAIDQQGQWWLTIETSRGNDGAYPQGRVVVKVDAI